MLNGGLSDQFHSIYKDTISDKLYFHGGFQTAGGIQVNGCASWDGFKWDSLGKGILGLNSIGPGKGLLIRYKNKLYLQSINYRLYSWDFSTLKWDSVIGGKFSGNINCAAIYNDDLYLGGNFNGAGAVNSYNIIKYDGFGFTPITSFSFAYKIYAMAVYKNELYIGGNFINDTLFSGIARWNGFSWNDCAGGLKGGGPPEVTSLYVYNNRLYVGGFFSGNKEGLNPSIVAWDSIKWSGIGGIRLNSATWGGGGVTGMFQLKNKLYVIGSFNYAGSQYVNSPIAIWNDTSWCKSNTNIQSTLFLAESFKDDIYLSNGVYIENDSVNYIGKWIGGQFADSCSAFTFIKEHKLQTVQVFPNPAYDKLFVKTELSGVEYSYSIYNSIGQIIKTGLIKENSTTVDLIDLQAGLYFIEITLNKERVTKKFVKHD